MQRQGRFLTLLSLPIIVLLGTTLGSGPRQAAKPDFDALARKLVTQVTNVREGDLVRIRGGTQQAELLENLAVEVRKLGAFPVITLGSDRLDRRMYDEIPAKYDGQTPSLELKLAGLVTAEINVDFSERPDNLSGVPVNRIATVDSASGAVANLLYARSVVQVNLGNEMYPSPALAEQFGVSQEQLSEIFWGGIDVDYRQLQATGERVRAILEGGSEIHITNPNGTDLRARIDDSMVYVSDGVVSDGERERGGPGRLVWLPAGEVYLAPLPGTAHGKIVVDRYFFRGKEISDLTLSFENGSLTSMDAASDFVDFKDEYDAAGHGKEVFGFIDVGINPSVRVPSGSRMMVWMAAGMVTVGFGSNAWAGGHNNVPYGTSTHLPGSTGQVVVDGGVLAVGPGR
jgi:leucyl aminopeptidase (aminopeptidase T)